MEEKYDCKKCGYRYGSRNCLEYGGPNHFKVGYIINNKNAVMNICNNIVLFIILVKISYYLILIQ